LLALGSGTNFFNNAGIDWAVTMKNLSDAALLRNRVVAFLEGEPRNRRGRPPAMAYLRHRGWRICRRGTAGAVKIISGETAVLSQLADDEIRVVVIHPGDYLLPELGKSAVGMRSANCASAKWK
jgi:hypothetical protein